MRRTTLGRAFCFGLGSLDWGADDVLWSPLSWDGSADLSWSFFQTFLICCVTLMTQLICPDLSKIPDLQNSFTLLQGACFSIWLSATVFAMQLFLAYSQAG